MSGIIEGVSGEGTAAPPGSARPLHERRLGELDVATDELTALVRQILGEMRRIRFGMEQQFGTTFVDPEA